MTCGKWSNFSLPLEGWMLSSVWDCGSDRLTCGACGTSIRYVHNLVHDDVEDGVGVGCVCAEALTKSSRGKALEQELRARAGRRSTWLDGFTYSEKLKKFKRNPKRGEEGIVLVQNCTNGNWRWSYTRGKAHGWFSGFAKTKDEAAYKAFDAMYPEYLR